MEKEFACVYVLNRGGRPLMPCHPAKARKLMKEGRAVATRRVPFTIQLTAGASSYRQKVHTAEDPGKTIGAAAVREDGQVLFLGEAACRSDISELLYGRAALRRGRRNRKTRYRPARFQNRRRPEGWVPPSIRQLTHEHEKLFGLLREILPVTDIAVEVNKFDFQRMENPGIKGAEYQNGPMKGFRSVRAYVLERDGYACVLCGDAGKRRQARHIVWRFRGGSDRPRNLVTLCEECCGKVAVGEIEVATVAEAYRWAARVNVMRAHWYKQAGLAHMTGWQTKESRESLGLLKTHANDALAVVHAAFEVPVKTDRLPRLMRGRYMRSKNRSLHRQNPQKGGVRPRANVNRYLVNKAGVRIMKYDLVECRVGGRRVVGYVNTLRSAGNVRVADACGKQLADGVSVNRLRKLQDADTLIWSVPLA